MAAYIAGIIIAINGGHHSAAPVAARSLAQLSEQPSAAVVWPQAHFEPATVTLSPEDSLTVSQAVSRVVTFTTITTTTASIAPTSVQAIEALFRRSVESDSISSSSNTTAEQMISILPFPSLTPGPLEGPAIATTTSTAEQMFSILPFPSLTPGPLQGVTTTTAEPMLSILPFPALSPSPRSIVSESESNGSNDGRSATATATTTTEQMFSILPFPSLTPAPLKGVTPTTTEQMFSILPFPSLQLGQLQKHPTSAADPFSAPSLWPRESESSNSGSSDATTTTITTAEQMFSILPFPALTPGALPPAAEQTFSILPVGPIILPRLSSSSSAAATTTTETEAMFSILPFPALTPGPLPTVSASRIGGPGFPFVPVPSLSGVPALPEETGAAQ